jgi:adenylate cyclase
MTEMPNLLIMFADIGGSTQLYETLGDVTARRLLSDCIDVIIGSVRDHSGTVIKTIGDEVMSTFRKVEDGVTAAADIAEAFADRIYEDKEHGPFGLAVRIGMHFGPAIEDVGDVFGDAVNVAARIVELAKPGQIITTEPTVVELSRGMRAHTRFVERTTVKGKKETLSLYEVIWRLEDATNISGNIEQIPPRATISLVLRYNDGEPLVLDENHAFATLGRSKLCDITIDDRLTSRQHVKIEYRRGKFFITDQSTNGTYLALGKGERAFLRREELQLTGNGIMSLGRAFEDKRSKPVHFELQGHTN